jgi:hypothetical protein
VHDLMAAGSTSAGPVPVSIPHLDLRPPVDLFDAAARDTAHFPSSLHRQSLTALQTTAGQSSLSQTRGTDESTARTPGRLEELARRVHREGLPIARLWENRSALVSLGLNQRGKPGLWVVQKIH